MVQCRNWEAQVTGEEVASVHLAATDLGIGRAIIVTAMGWGDGVEASARRLGIDLWGPVEIESRLGRIPRTPREVPRAAVRGLRVNMTEAQAVEMVGRVRRGALRMGREEAVWVRPFWLPFLPIRIRHTREEKDHFRRPVPRTRLYLNVYEALGGSLFAQWEQEPETIQVRESRVRARVTAHSVVSGIEEVAKRLNEARTPQSQERQEATLNARGIPTPVSFFDLEPEPELYVPFYLALVRNRTGERVVAVDAHRGDMSDPMGRVAMMHLTYIEEFSAL